MTLQDEEEDEIPSASASKKRRLRTEQVRALEQNFDQENRLEPDRKSRLAHELGLQPRQVAVWFQNRRARWKTKQLERDFSALKSKYEALRLGFDSLRRDNSALVEQLGALKAKVGCEEKARGACESESSADVFKVEEEEEDWEAACGAGLFADEHGSALAWFSAEIAAGGGGGGGGGW